MKSVENFLFIKNMFKIVQSNINRYPISQFNKLHVVYASTSTPSTADVKTTEEQLSEDPLGFEVYDERLEKEAELQELIEKNRYVARFPTRRSQHKHQMEEHMFVHPESLKLRDVKFYRKMYAKYGKATGIDPALGWPTKSELDEMIDDEKTYHLTLKQKIETFANRKYEEIEQFKKIYEETETNLKKTPKLVDEYYQKIVKKYQQEDIKKERHKALLEQAREFYGYNVDLRDTRMQEMLTKLEEQKKLQDKKEKKLAKKAKVKELTDSVKGKKKAAEKKDDEDSDDEEDKKKAKK